MHTLNKASQYTSVSCILEASVTATDEQSRGEARLNRTLFQTPAMCFPFSVWIWTYLLLRLLTGEGAAGRAHGVDMHSEWEGERCGGGTLVLNEAVYPLDRRARRSWEDRGKPLLSSR